MRNINFFKQVPNNIKIDKNCTKKYMEDLTFIKKEFYKENDIASEATIATANFKNKYKVGNKEGISPAIIELLKEDVSVIGTQEVTNKILKELETSLNEYDYHITGDFRWGHGIMGLLFAIANEGNQIISKNEIYMSKTSKLPWIPKSLNDLKISLKAGSIMPRIATSCVTKINGIGYCRIYNTHLDYGNCKIQRKQMNQLINIIDQDQKQISLPTIITGDWNATLENKNMKYFIHVLHEYGINISKNNQPTFKGKFSDEKIIESPKVLDYVAIDNHLTINDVAVISNPTSDHDILKVKVKK